MCSSFEEEEEVQARLKYFANVGPMKEAEWQHAQAVENGSMKTVCHCHKMFGPNLTLNGLLLAVISVCNIVYFVFLHCNIYLVFNLLLYFNLPVLCNYGSHALNCVQY